MGSVSFTWSVFCYVNLDRSNLLFLAMSMDENEEDNVEDIFFRRRVYLMDFFQKKLIQWPHLIYEEDSQLLISSSAIITFEKSGKRYIVH